MDAENTYNEQEARDAIYDHIQSDPEVSETVKNHCTHEVIDKILDTSNDLAEGAFIQGKGLKFQGIGSFYIANLSERQYSVPDGDGSFRTGVTPAYKTVRFSASEKLVRKMNEPLA